MLSDEGIDGKFRKGIWTECASTARFMRIQPSPEEKVFD
jgi:hypothetical protein